MKKIIALIGIAGMMCLAPSCKKNNAIVPQENTPVAVNPPGQNTERAQLRVLLHSKRCAGPQQYTSAFVEIKSVKVKTEQGWEELKLTMNGWDLIRLQHMGQPMEFTEEASVHAGAVTQIAVTFGEDHKLMVGDQTADCFQVSGGEVIVDFKGDLKANTMNQIVLSADVCGNINIHKLSDQRACYIMKPVLEVQSWGSPAN